MDNYFYEIFENIPRQGPGTDSSTEKAWREVENQLPTSPRILDIGCGKGAQTLVLARISGGEITAVDLHQPFLDSLEKAAGEQQINTISCIQADMASLPFREKEFDLIWAEGSAFVMGVREALKNWKKFIREEGFLVVSDLVWLSDSRPPELTAFFEEECPYVLTRDELCNEAQQIGYEVQSHFILPEAGWVGQYYTPQRKHIEVLRKKYAHLPEVMALYDSLEKEREIYSRYSSYYGYVFYILRNK